MRAIESLKTQYRVSDFITWQRDKLLVLNPNFQRRSVWKKGAKSYLIDTIIRGLPVPIIFLRDLNADLKTFKSKRDVVDGQQRLRTIITFIAPHLLDDFDAETDAFTLSKSHSIAYAGKQFEELPKGIKQTILDYQFSVHSFNADTDDKEILQIFARMNSSGYKLNAQELRNAEYFGEFKQTAYELALEQYHRWVNWKVFTSDQISRMSEVEFVSELMILIIQGLTAQSKTRIDNYYKEFDNEFLVKPEVIFRLRHVFDVIDAAFGAYGVKEGFNSKALFYALFAAIYDLSFGIRKDADIKLPLLQQQHGIGDGRPRSITKDATAQILAAGQVIRTGAPPQAVQRALRGATGDLSSRRIVIDFLLGRKQ